MPAERPIRRPHGGDAVRGAARTRTPSGFVVAELDYAAHHRQAAHAHGGTSVTLILAGSVRERAASREEIGRPLSVVVKPAGVAHSDEYGPEGLDTVQIALPGGAAAPEPEAGLSGDWRWIHAGTATRAFLEVVRVLRRAPEDGVSLEWAVTDTLGALQADRERVASRRPPTWLRRARELMDDADPGSLTVARVAAEAGVHPVSLTRAFRRYNGVTTSRYLRRVRVRHAARLMADATNGLSRVAFSAGFADQSHMTRDIRGETGVTPGDLRRLLGSGPRGRRPRDADGDAPPRNAGREEGAARV